MRITLRKWHGRFEAMIGSSVSRSTSLALPATRSLESFLFSPLVLAFLAIAFLVAWSLTHPILAVASHAHSATGLALVGVMGSLRELRDKRANLASEMRAVLDQAEKEKRNLNGEENVKYDKLFGEVEELRTRIEREERQAEIERSLAMTKEPAVPSPEARAAADKRAKSPRGTDEYRDAFGAFLARGTRGMSPEEQRALSVGTDTAGGFTTASEQFIGDLIKNVDNILWIRQLARKLSVPTAMSLGAMTLDADPDDADWTSELAMGTEDSAMAFGKRKLTPHPLAKSIKVSNDFLRQTLTGGESLVRDRLGYKFGVSQEKGFMTGTGVGQALGIFTASADGIPTSRDISTDNTTTAPTFDGLINAKYALKQQYWTDKLRWVFHRDVMKVITKLKDGENRYIWRESVKAGEPDQILNIGIAMSEYAPNTMTTGLYVGALGNFEWYWIADAYDVAIKRLDELFAMTNQVGFIGRMAVDGQPVLAEAFVRVKLA